MPEEKPELPPVKEFLEMYYGKKFRDPTPEKLEKISQDLKVLQERAKAKKQEKLQRGQESR